MAAAKVSALRSRAACAAAALAIAGALGSASFAHAQEPGVVYEPGSPSDKEYAIPLEETRKDAGGRQPGAAVPLAFGIGLSRRVGGPARSGSGGNERPEGRAARRARRGGERGAGASSRGEPNLGERLAEAEGAGAPALWRLGPALLVVLPALLVGLALLLRYRGRTAATG